MRRPVILLALVACLAVAVPASARLPIAVSPDPFAQPADVQDIVFLTPNRPVFIRLHVKMDGKPFRRAWTDYFAYLHKHLDTDGDGMLSGDEQKRLPPPQPLNPYYVSVTTFKIVNVKSGKRIQPKPKPPKPLSRRDLQLHYRKLGALPFQLVGQNGGYWVDYSISIESTGAARRPVNAATLNKALVQALDVNMDGKVSKRELKALERRLLQRDFDDDEVLSTRETLGDSSPGGNFGNGLVFATSIVELGQSKSSRLIELTSPRPEDAKRLAQRLMQKYGPNVIKEPIPGLTREQLGLTKSVFAFLDKNNDTWIDAGELARFTFRQPDVEMSIDLGKKDNVRLTSEKSAASISRGKSVDIGAIRLDFRLPAPAPASPTASFDEKPFRGADRDNNGYVDENEARSSPFAATFKLIDADQDGKVFLKEVKAHHRKNKEVQERANKSWVSLDVNDDGRGLFGMIDLDRDDRLSVREMREAVRLLKELDRNGDGAFSLDEIPRRFDLTVSTGTARPDYSAAEIQAANAGTAVRDRSRKLMPLWFQKMDRNRDGDVSAREFVGGKTTFDQIDADSDGLLSMKEALAADARYRSAP